MSGGKTSRFGFKTASPIPEDVKRNANLFVNTEQTTDQNALPSTVNLTILYAEIRARICVYLSRQFDKIRSDPGLLQLAMELLKVVRSTTFLRIPRGAGTLAVTNSSILSFLHLIKPPKMITCSAESRISNARSSVLQTP